MLHVPYHRGHTLMNQAATYMRNWALTEENVMAKESGDGSRPAPSNEDTAGLDRWARCSRRFHTHMSKSGFLNVNNQFRLKTKQKEKLSVGHTTQPVVHQFATFVSQDSLGVSKLWVKSSVLVI